MNKLKEKLLEIKERIYNNPKKFYKYSMIFLAITLAFNIWREIYYPPNYYEGMVTIPKMFPKSDDKIDALRKQEKDKLEKNKIILHELRVLAKKRELNTLTKDDELRAEFLINQYNEINKDGGFKKD